MNPEPSAASESWDSLLANLRHRHPGASDGILFCVYKLQLNPDVGLRDLRPEADLHGLRLGGRSLHSAKVLLGYSAPALRNRTTAPEPAAPPPRVTPLRRSPGIDGLESRIFAAARRLRADSEARSEQLSEAIREALTLIDEVLAEHPQ